MRLMYRTGAAIGTKPGTAIAVTIFGISTLLSYFAFFPIIIETDIRRGFANKKGASVNEFMRFSEFYNLSMYELEVIAVFLEPKNGDEASIEVTPQLIDDVERLDKLVTTLVVPSEAYGRLSFSDFVTDRGDVNFFFKAFKLAYDIQVLNGPNDSDPSIILSYPTGRVYGHNISLGAHFFGAHLNENFQKEGLPTEIVATDSIGLFYITRANGHARKRMLQEWETALLRISEQRNFSAFFDFYIYGDQVANSEMERGTFYTASLIVIGVILMILYMAYILRCLSVKSQVILIMSALGSPLFAALCSFAVFGWLGIAFNSIMSISPILILGIGVDDAFLLLHCWRSHRKLTNAKDRMAAVMAEIGPSITITSATNMLAFGAGVISPAPMMSQFCMLTSLAVGFDFVLELSLFAPSLVISSRWAVANEIYERKTVSTNVESGKTDERHSTWWRYAKFLASKRGRLAVITVLISMYTISFFGIVKMEATFDPSKTFPSDSVLVRSVHLVDRIYKLYAPVTFVVNRPPNISDPDDYRTFMNMVERLESLPESYGRSRTLLWLLDYDEYCLRIFKESARNDSEFRPTYDHLVDFLESKFLDDKSVVRYHFSESKSVIVDSFVFVVIFRGTKGWYQRARSAEKLREQVLKYPQYNVTIFDYDATIFDLITTVKKELGVSVLITLACMACVCSFFIPDIVSIVIAALSVLSIFFCLLGMLSWWGLDLDPVTMVNVLMAIGFSVDFSAHICYHFYNYNRNGRQVDRCDEPNVERMANIFKSIGKPMIEAGASTVVCMLPLFMVSAYLITSFVKTVCLVAGLGSLHGLFIIPAILSMRPYARHANTSSTLTNELPKSDAEEKPMLNDNGILRL